MDKNIVIEDDCMLWGGLYLVPQFEEIIPLAIDLFLVKQANKWGLIRFNTYGEHKVSCKEGYELNVCHAVEIPFQVTNSSEKIRAYAVDDYGEKGFFNVNNTGCFSVPIKYLNEDGCMHVGIEMDGIQIGPGKWCFEVKYSKGFEVIGPRQASVDKVGRSSFNITIKNKSKQEAKPFDVVVDGRFVGHMEGLRPSKSISLPVSKIVRIDDLEDSENKSVKVEIREEGLRGQTYSVKILFEKVYE